MYLFLHIPQTVDDSSDERPSFANLHTTNSVHFETALSVQHINTLSELGHAYFAKSSQQLAHLIWLFKIICGSFEQHFAQL
jgi:hypothetical protein